MKGKFSRPVHLYLNPPKPVGRKSELDMVITYS
jgi:hypothetical protein